LKKILFYGNCQAAVLGGWIHYRYSDLFEVFDCADCGLQGVVNTKNFPVWSPENYPNQKDFYKCIENKIEKCDIFIFHHTHKLLVNDLKTEILCSTVAKNKIKICLSNQHFLGYPICHRSLYPFMKYIYNNTTKDNNKILNYLKYEELPEFKNILWKKYNSSMVENIKIYKNMLKLYENVIDMNPFVIENWKNNLLFGTLNHPVGLYWEELIKKIFKILDVPLRNEIINDFTYPSKEGIINPSSFIFFKKMFPNLLIPKEITNLYEPDINFIKRISDELIHIQ
jgi:hypothetical protein